MTKVQTAAVALLAFAVYAGTLSHELVWDDPALVETTKELVRAGGVTKLLSAEFVLDRMSGESLGYYRPMVLLSLWADSRLAEAFPGAFHLTNVLLHVAGSVLVLLFARLVLASPTAAFVAALLFAVYPVHTESVAFVSGRTDLWATVFALIACVVWAGAQGGRPSRGALALSGAALLLAALSKETAFVLPVVLLAWSSVRARDGWWKRNAPWLAAWAAALIVAAILRWNAGVSFGTGDRPSFDLLHALAAWAMYPRLLVFPWPLNAAYDSSELTLSAGTVIGTAAFLAVCLAAFGRSHQRVGLVALLWVVGFLLPVSGLLFFRASAVAERFLYLPSVGFALVAGHWAARLTASARLRRPAFVAIALVTVALSVATAARSRIWENDLTLARDIVRGSPGRPLAHNNLGLEYYKAERYDDAIAAFRTAIRLNPSYALARTNLGLAFRQTDQDDDALAEFEQAVRLEPEHPGMLFNLANHYHRLGRLRDAATAFESAARRMPGSADVQFMLGRTYGDMGLLDEAARAYGRAIELRPGAAEAHFRLGLVHLAAGNQTGARRELAVLRQLRSAYATELGRRLGSTNPES